MILLTNEEIVAIEDKHFGEGSGTGFTDQCQFDICKAQLKKVVGVLKDKTVKAWGGNRVILSEDWQALLKECE